MDVRELCPIERRSLRIVAHERDDRSVMSGAKLPHMQVDDHNRYVCFRVEAKFVSTTEIGRKAAIAAVPVFVLEWWENGAPEEMKLGTAMSLLRLLISETTVLKAGGTEQRFHRAEDVAVEAEEIFVRIGGHSDALLPAIQFGV